MKYNYPAVALCVLTLAGCAATHRYQLSRDDAGRLVRLDTQTGEVALIEGDKVTQVKGTAEATVSAAPQGEQIPPVSLPNGGKSWPALTLLDLGNTNAALTSYWYNGKLHYVLELYPFSKRLKLVYGGYYRNASFTLMVNNKAGKQVVWTAVPSNRLKHTISQTRNVEQLSAEGVIVMTKEDYDSLAGWQLQWNP